MSATIFACGVAVAAIFISLRFWTFGHREPGLPPGPKTLPILGNLLDFPRTAVHIQFAEWSRQYGSIFSLKLGGGTLIVLSSANAVKELIDKSGWNASSRPPNFLISLICDNQHIVFTPDSPHLRALKRVLSRSLSPQAAAKYIPILEAESTQLMVDLLDHPQDFFLALRRYTHSAVKSAIYGKRVPHYTSAEATEFFDIVATLEHTITPGTHPPVDLIPILQRIPARWASWTRECQVGNKRRNALHFSLFHECETRVVKGEDPRSFIEDTLTNMEDLKLDRESIAYLSIVLLEGGTDTSAAFLQSLVLFLAAYPDVQRKAQAEMDAVVDDKQLPVDKDIKKMPYVRALIKEVNRCRPMLPLGIPHTLTQDDHYNNYLVPKQSTVLVNIWEIFNDPEIFEDPHIFNPDRFMATEYGTKLPDQGADFRDSLIFGSGRRICPGQHVAQHTLDIATMRLLWAFNFTPGLDPETSNPVALDVNDYNMDLTLAPNPFKCTITARGDHRVKLIREGFYEATSVFTRYEDTLTADEKAELTSLRANH